MLPTILIPGLTGTKLVNVNGTDFHTLWSSIQSKYEAIDNLALTCDSQFDVCREAIIERADVEDLPYKQIVCTIRDMGAPVYVFGYDWRKSCVENGRKLHQFVRHLQGKLQISSFNFVTHSMGGLIFSCFLKELALDYHFINRAAIAVCPFLGSVNAFVTLIKGEGGSKFPLFNDNDGFQKIARTFPSVYELCPTYPDAVSFAAAAMPFDIYNPLHWQSNIAGLPVFQARLAALTQFRDSLVPLSQLPDNVRDRIITLAGEGEETRVRTVIRPEGYAGEPVRNFFDFEQPMGDGDATLPLQSATAYKDAVRTFVIRSKWYDRCNHSFFLNDSHVQDLIRLFLEDRIDQWQQAPNIRKA